MAWSAPTPWLLRGAPADGEFVVFGFHYAGSGASSSYSEWPARLGTGVLAPLQPPGRETRMSEPPLPDVWSYASALAAELVPFLDRPYAFIGHCGAFPYMIETTFSLLRLGAAPPGHLFASSWGAPHTGLYGRLNFADLDRLDISTEITEVVRRRTGLRPSAELIDLAGEALMTDLRALRSYRYQGQPRIPAPTTVLAWSEDDIVPPDEVWPSQWQEYAMADYRLLDGDHWEFLRAPRALTDLIATTMQSGEPTRRPGG